jgi:UDP-N-acetylglucosamine 4,6-dehydratase/5-epimerase
MLSGKTVLITGGTGSFGNAFLKKIIDSDIKEVRIFSRDEKKQHDMRVAWQNEKIKFYIGDVRNFNSLSYSMKGVDYVFHAAALKQVPSCEFFPFEAVQTNVIGTENVLNSAIDNNVKKVVCLSTDKAVYPINSMGISKAMMEKIATAKSRVTDNTCITITRYGNVLASRGSVIPHFIDQIKNGKDITITDPQMTRFIMTLEQAVDLVLYAFVNGNPGDIFVQKAPAATIDIIAKALNIIFESNSGIKIIGARHGEKLYESLLSKEEYSVAEDLGGFFKVKADNRDLNYDKYFSNSSSNIDLQNEYHSHNTQQLEIGELCDILNNLSYVKEQLV